MCSRKSSSPTVERSLFASSGRSASWGFPRLPSTRTPTARPCHAAYADEAYALGGWTAAESYLVVDKLLEAAAALGGRGSSPGYGFLAENAAFARAVEAAGLIWIGPPPAAIELMGSKTRARQAMQAAGVPIIPGTTDPVDSADEVVRLGAEIGYPLLIKAAAGGGGKGMKVVRSAERGGAGVRLGAPRRPVVLRRLVRLRRAVPRGSAPRRGPGARRRATAT